MSFAVERWRPGPLLPPRDARDGALFFVIATLCFLACLTLIGALAANRAADGWRSQLVGSATVIVRPQANESADAAAVRGVEALSALNGVTEARVLERAKADELLKPWIGDLSVLQDLPVPRLIVLDLDRKAPATGAQIAQALKAGGIDASVDDHSQWMDDITRGAGWTRAAALGVFALIAAAAAAVVAFATRAGLIARQELVEVLHLSGARDVFVATLFQARFARMAALAGAVGGLAAMLAAAAMRLGGGGAGLTPVLPVAWTDLLAPLPCPLVAALVAAVAARVTAMRMLRAADASGTASWD